MVRPRGVRLKNLSVGIFDGAPFTARSSYHLISVDLCDPNVCINGQCLRTLRGYTCQCNDGYAGTHCDGMFVCK